MNIPVYNNKGEQVKTIEAPDKIWAVERHGQSEFLSVIQRLAGSRRGTASTKVRDEVRGGGKRPWRQKGTGRARHSSRRSPLWPGGGVTFGPKPRSYDFKINRKERRLALFSALSSIVRENRIRILEGMMIEIPAIDTSKRPQITKKALEVVGKNVTNKTLLIYHPDKNGEVGLALNNTKEIYALSYTALNVYDILDCTTLVVTSEAMDGIREVWND
jgi:large subunit ribosomal protein L4